MADQADHQPPKFGDLDGEVIEFLSLRLTGGGRFSRLPRERERVILIVEGTVVEGATFDRVDDRLVRVHRVKVDAVAEPRDLLAAVAAGFLRDELEKRQRLPFPPETSPTTEGELENGDPKEGDE